MTQAKDMKAALNSGAKPDVSQVRGALKRYCARACEYGNAKYVRANFLRPTDSLADDFRRLRVYLGAADRHITATLDAMEAHQALDPDLLDENGMRRAAFAEDTDPDTTGRVGPSFLPHLAGAIASMNMALEQATRAGLLPSDPGQPWVERVALAQKLAEREYARANPLVIDKDRFLGTPMAILSKPRIVVRPEDAAPSTDKPALPGMPVFVVEHTAPYSGAPLRPPEEVFAPDALVEPAPTRPSGDDCRYTITSAEGTKLRHPRCAAHGVPLDRASTRGTTTVYRCRLTQREVTP